MAFSFWATNQHTNGVFLGHRRVSESELAVREDHVLGGYTLFFFFYIEIILAFVFILLLFLIFYHHSSFSLSRKEIRSADLLFGPLPSGISTSS